MMALITLEELRLYPRNFFLKVQEWIEGAGKTTLP